MLKTPAVLAACLALLLMASACTDDSPDPNYSSVSTSPTPSTSPTSSDTSSPTGIPATGPNVGPGEEPPIEPSSANSHSQDGALAFASYYYRMSDWTFATSNIEILEPFFSADCTQCRQAQTNLAGLLDGGNHFEGGRITTLAVNFVENDGRRTAEYALTGQFAVSAASVKRGDGTLVDAYVANDDLQLTDWVRWDDDHWVIVEERRV